MNLKEIMAISGYPGLFKHISQGRNGIIVESLTDKKRMQAYSSMKVSSLEDIAVFTNDEEISLKEVLKRIFDKESGGPALSGKSSPKEIIAYFEEVLPEYNRDKVYTSDIKKIINWYNLLQELNMLEFEEVDEQSEETKEELGVEKENDDGEGKES